jgi:hypothetical protein
MSSRESAKRVRSSTAIASSSAAKPVARVCGVAARSATSWRFFQRRTVVWLMPSSRASAAAPAGLCWI